MPLITGSIPKDTPRPAPQPDESPPTNNMPRAERTSCQCSSSGRNLIICIDGTSNQFGPNNTNVIELYSQLVQSDHQLTYYNSGIGTYAKPSWKSWSYWKQVLDHKIDLAIAWNFERIVIAAYRWLSENYQPHDRIYLFGFSRGAYQVRALAGMIEKVGLIRKGNDEQIAFAYELYADPKSNEYIPPGSSATSKLSILKNWLKRLVLRRPKEPDGSPTDRPILIDLADRFKTTFSRDDVRVHFVGVWDTVSSVGIIRDKNLPLTDTANHVCFFRHALALDECRVKFLPEYVHGGVSQARPQVEEQQRPENGGNHAVLEDGAVEMIDGGVGGAAPSPLAHIKEVWFPGTHSDIGGGNRLNVDLDLGNTPFLWMKYEAISSGLDLMSGNVEWDWQRLGDVQESLTWVWRVFEWLPFKRLSYEKRDSTTFRWHKGRGRKIQPGQKIHASVAFCESAYHPKAILPDVYRSTASGAVGGWGTLAGSGDRDAISWAEEWRIILEMDIFDHSAANAVIHQFISQSDKDATIWLHRLAAMTWCREGCAALMGVKEVIPHLAWRLRTGSTDVQMGVLKVLGALQDTGYFTMLTEATMDAFLAVIIDDVNPASVRSDAARLLSKCILGGGEQSIQLLLESNEHDALPSLLREQDGVIIEKSLTALERLLEYAAFYQRMSDSDTESQRNSSDSDTESQRSLPDTDTESRSDPPDNNSCRVGREALPVPGLVVNHNDLHQRILDAATISELHTKLQDPDRNVRREALRVMGLAMNHKILHQRMFESEMILKLRSKLRDDDWVVQQEALKVVGLAVNHDGLHEGIFDNETTVELHNSLCGLNAWNVRQEALKVLCLAIKHAGLRQRVFNAETVLIWRDKLCDEAWHVRHEALKVLSLAIGHDELRRRMLDAATISMLHYNLRDHASWHVRQEALKVLGLVINHCDIRQSIFNTETMSGLRSNLRYSEFPGDSWEARVEALRVLRLAIIHDLDRQIFDATTISLLRGNLHDDVRWVRQAALKVLGLAINHDDARQQMVKDETISVWRNNLRDEEPDVRQEALKVLGLAINCDDIRQLVFNAETISDLRSNLRHPSWWVRLEALNVFNLAITLDGVRHLMIDAETTSELSSNLRYSESWCVRVEALKVLGLAISHDELRSRILDAATILELRNRLHDDHPDVLGEALKVLSLAINHDDLGQRLFDAETVSVCRSKLRDDHWYVRQWALNLLGFAINHDDLFRRMFDMEMRSDLRRSLCDDIPDVRGETLKVLGLAITRNDVHSLIFDAETLSELRSNLRYSESWCVRVEALKVLGLAISHDELRRQIIDAATISELHGRLHDDDSMVCGEALKVLSLAINIADVHERIFNTETIAVWRSKLRHDVWYVRKEALKALGIAVNHDDFAQRIFDAQMMSELRRNLDYRFYEVQEETLIVLGRLANRDDLRVRMFDVKMVSALYHCAPDGPSNAQREALKILSVAVNHDGLRGKLFDVVTIWAIRALAEHAHNKDVQAEANRLLGLTQELTRWPFAVPHTVGPVAPM